MFELLQKAGLRMKIEKCSFFSTKMELLGFEVTSRGIGPQQDKLNTIRDMVVGHDKSAIKSFLLLVRYYQRFVPNLAQLARGCQFVRNLLAKMTTKREGKSEFTRRSQKNICHFVQFRISHYFSRSSRPILLLFFKGLQTTDKIQWPVSARLVCCGRSTKQCQQHCSYFGQYYHHVGEVGREGLPFEEKSFDTTIWQLI